MARMRKEFVVVLMTALLGLGAVVYFNACAAAEELLKDTGIPKDTGNGGDEDAGCTPDCTDKECGSDGCDGTCGDCADGETCSAAGKCEPTVTDPCEGKNCGDDDGAGGKCQGPCPNEGETCVAGECVVCEPDCTGKECGDDGCEGSCGECTDPETCNETTFQCEAPGADCTGKFCGDDDGAGGKCTACANAGETCNQTTWVCEGGCTPDCTGKNCGELDSCGEAKCEGPCTGSGENCIGGPDWYCSTCAPECANAVCGADDGCGNKCVGSCSDPNAPWCDPMDYTCKTDPCAGATCGEQKGNYICLGACPNAGEECKVDPADGMPKCVSCNANGAGVGEVCADQAACKCGNDCVKLFQNDAECQADPTTCQKRGECLEDCFADGKCADATQLCACTKGDANNNCIAGDCFAQGKLTGNFAAKTLNSCNDQPGSTDIGSGNMSYSVAGKSYSWNMFIACHYISDDGTQDLVLVQGLKVCGQQACPDWILVGAVTADLKVGEMKMSDGKIFAEHDQVTVSGQTITDYWIRGLGIDGKVNFTAAGKTGKQAISGTTDITMIKYDYEVCGGNTGDPCQ